MARYQIKAGGRYTLRVGRKFRLVTVGSKPLAIIVLVVGTKGVRLVKRLDTNTEVATYADYIERR